MHLASIFLMVAPPNTQSAEQIKGSQDARVRTSWSLRILSKINCKTQKKSPRVSRSLGTRGLRDFDENESKCMSMLASGEISQWFS